MTNMSKASTQCTSWVPRRLARLSGALGCLLAASAAIASPQEQVAQTASRRPVRVFVVDFSQPDAIPEMGDLGRIAAGLVRLRLLEMPALEVHHALSVPPCGTQAPPGLVGPEAQAAPQLLRSQQGTGDFYVVQGSVGVLRAPDISVDFSLQFCADGSLQTLIHKEQPFTADRALEQISIVSNFISFRLAELVPTVKVTIGPLQAEDEKEIADSLKFKLAETISDMPGLEVADSAEYAILGRITVPQKVSRLLFLPRPKSNNLKLEDLKIVAHDKPYPLESISGTRDKLPEFYSKVSAEVRRTLPQVLLAERLGWPELLDNMTADDLFAKGKMFLCEEEPPECKKDLQSAIPILTKATVMRPKDHGSFLLLGKAQYLSRHYLEAVKALEDARKIEQAEKSEGRSVAKEEEVAVLDLLGDAYNGIEKYDRAIESYNQSLGLDPSQAKIYDKKALAAGYSGNRPAALKTLIEGLHQTGNSGSASGALRQSTKSLIQRLESPELPSAEGILKEAYEIEGYPVSNEYALLLEREGSEAIDSAKGQEDMKHARSYLERALGARPLEDAVRASVLGNLIRSYLGSNLDKANSLLTEAEHIPPEHLSSNLRAWLLQLRAWYWIDVKNYEKAYAVAQNAHDTEHSKWGDLALARAALNLGKTKEDTAARAPGDRNQLLLEVKRLYQQAFNLLDPLVNDRVGDADFDYLEASHGLGRDTEAVARFQKIVEQLPRDASALRSILFICTEYLFQSECAYKAAMQDVEAEAPNADAYLNAIEVAVLHGKNAQAEQWLATMFTLPEVTAYQKSIGYFYRLWLAAHQNQKEAEKSAFRAWQAALEEFRKTDEEPTWSFRGTRHALEHTQFDVGMKELFTSVIAALEDRTKPIPGFSPR
jgi:tetratricopeptide repeat protein